MYKIKYLFIIFILILCVSVPISVYAANFNGEPPYINNSSGSLSVRPEPEQATNFGYPRAASFSSNCSTVYYFFDDFSNGRGFKYYFTLSYNIGSAPVVSVDNCALTTGSYSYTYNNQVYNIYYSRGYISVMEGYPITVNGETKTLAYPLDCNLTYVNHKMDTLLDYQTIINYFLFGIGDLDFVKPSEDIADSDLDIHGLNGWVGSDQYVGADDNTVSAAFDSFIQALFDKISTLPVINAFIDTDKVFPNKLGYVNTTVPGCNMIWDTPSVGVNILASDDFPTYTIWVDGSATAELSVYGETYSADVVFSKLQLYSGQLRDNPSTTSFYNSNSSYQVILNYILNNSNFVSSTYSGFDQTILNTYIKRLYIQASKVDLNGDNHYGAISYIDFNADGSVFVNEGVTEDISEIPESDDDGVDNTVTQPYTVSGDTIIYGDTITNNNTIINYTGGGLSVGDSSFLDAGIALINAILELIKLLFASWLVPFITLGWTGHF